MFTEPRQEILFGMMKDYFEKNRPDEIHDIDHIVRVMYWTELVSEKEGADLSITIPAAILHDIAIPEHGDEMHAREGARMCVPFLKKCGYSGEEIKRISDTISMHSTDDPKPPETLESRVLFDGDKMDAAGPVGLHRWILSYTIRKRSMHHEVLENILRHIDKWKKRYGDPPFFTKTGKELGGPGMKYIEDTCKEILRDMEKFSEFYKLINKKTK